MNLLLLLAQDPIPDVGKAIDWAGRAEKLGVVGLAMLFVFMTIAVAWWLLRRASDKEIALHEAVATAHGASTKQAEVNSKLEKEFREKVEALLREMLERGEDQSEALASNTQAVRDMTQGMQQLTTRIEYVERAVQRPS